MRGEVLTGRELVQRRRSGGERQSLRRALDVGINGDGLKRVASLRQGGGGGCLCSSRTFGVRCRRGRRLASAVGARLLTADVALQRVEGVAELILRGLQDIDLGSGLRSLLLHFSALGGGVLAWCGIGRRHEQTERDDGEPGDGSGPSDADRWSPGPIRAARVRPAGVHTTGARVAGASRDPAVRLLFAHGTVGPSASPGRARRLPGDAPACWCRCAQ